MTTRKISFQANEKLWERFTRLTSEICLAYAPFLDQVISTECEYISKDLEGLSNSKKAKSYIGGLLKRSGAKSVNIEMRRSTVDKLNAIVDEHNLSRSGLLSRVVLFMCCPDEVKSRFGIPLSTDEKSTGLNLEAYSTTPLIAMKEAFNDPLFYTRHHIQQVYEEGMYTVELPEEFRFASGYLSDHLVMTTTDHKTYTDEVLEDKKLLEQL